MVGLILFWPIFLALLCSAQTITTIDPDSGQTIVEVLTLDPQGNPLTRTLSTLAAIPNTGTSATSTTSTTSSTTSTSASTITSTTSPNNQPGPVGQPASTTATPGAPTPFTYTTIVNGQTVVATGVFTPTNPGTTPVTPTASGTIWNLSSYLQQYGPTTPTGAASMTKLGAAAVGLLGIQIARPILCLFPDLLLF